VKESIVIANNKGGVGKTTSVINIGNALAEMGNDVLIVDNDPQGNATLGLGFDPPDFEAKNIFALYTDEENDFKAADLVLGTQYPKLHLIPSHINLSRVETNELAGYEGVIRNIVHELGKHYDYILIDTPPNLARLTKSAMIGATKLIIPIQCEFFAVYGVSEVMRTLQLMQRKMNPDIKLGGAFMTMYDSRLGFANTAVEEVKEYFKDRFYKTIIPKTVRVTESQRAGKPIQIYEKDSSAANAYNELAKEVIS
jgi:chromosome partitioning protein